MRLAGVIVAVVSLVIPGSHLSAQILEAEHRANTKRLLELIVEEEAFLQMSEMIAAAIFSDISAPRSDVPPEAFAIVLEVANEVLEEHFDELRDRMVPLYAGQFSNQEIEELIRFYERDIGQRFVERQPALLQGSLEINQSWAQYLQPVLAKRIQARLAAEGIDPGAPSESPTPTRSESRENDDGGRSRPMQSLSFDLRINGVTIPFDVMESNSPIENAITTLAETFDAEVRLYLGLVPDGLFGSYETSERILINNQDTITLDEDFVQKVALPEPFNASNHQGLSINPPSARIARLATFCRISVDGVEEPYKEGCGLMEPLTNEPLVIAYFDSACELSGSLEFEGGSVTTYDVEIERPGFYILSGLSEHVTVEEVPARAQWIIHDS